MALLTRLQRSWALAVAAASAVVGGPAGCGGDGDSAGLTRTETRHVLRVQANGAGSGTVTAPDASPQLSCTITGGALSGVCAIAYPSNSTVRLVATPNGASTFAGWSGACTGAEGCVVEMSEERVVTASFERDLGPSSRARSVPRHLTPEAERRGGRTRRSSWRG